jgi:hypothetical protein
MVENQRSKAVLLLACEELCRRLPNVQYFPAYELMLDDLRDYRFYAADMIHPSEVAVDYIWEYFSHMFFDEKTRQLNHTLEKIQAATRHRPFHPDTAAYRQFADMQLGQIRDILAKYPSLNFNTEINFFESIL